MGGVEEAGGGEEPVEVENDEDLLKGDNQTASDDSRDPGTGNIKRDDIYGEVWFIAGPAADMGLI